MALDLNPMRNQVSHKDSHTERCMWLGNVTACRCPAQLFTIGGSHLGRDAPSNDDRGRWPLTTTSEAVPQFLIHGDCRKVDMYYCFTSLASKLPCYAVVIMKSSWRYRKSSGAMHPLKHCLQEKQTLGLTIKIASPYLSTCVSDFPTFRTWIHV